MVGIVGETRLSNVVIALNHKSYIGQLGEMRTDAGKEECRIQVSDGEENSQMLRTNSGPITCMLIFEVIRGTVSAPGKVFCR